MHIHIYTYIYMYIHMPGFPIHLRFVLSAIDTMDRCRLSTAMIHIKIDIHLLIKILVSMTYVKK